MSHELYHGLLVAIAHGTVGKDRQNRVFVGWQRRDDLSDLKRCRGSDFRNGEAVE